MQTIPDHHFALTASAAEDLREEYTWQFDELGSQKSLDGAFTKTCSADNNFSAMREEKVKHTA